MNLLEMDYMRGFRIALPLQIKQILGVDFGRVVNYYNILICVCWVNLAKILIDYESNLMCEYYWISLI